jgi:hypothetical protein
MFVLKSRYKIPTILIPGSGIPMNVLSSHFDINLPYHYGLTYTSMVEKLRFPTQTSLISEIFKKLTLTLFNYLTKNITWIWHNYRVANFLIFDIYSYCLATFNRKKKSQQQQFCHIFYELLKIATSKIVVLFFISIWALEKYFKEQNWKNNKNTQQWWIN